MRTDLTAMTGREGRWRCASGQVMLITVLAIVLLASVVFLLMNAGDQMNRRTAAQNAADSAAMSGATYMARSMNAVAMNNVGMSRMLSLVPVIDSLPVAFRASYEELDVWQHGLEQQIPNLRRDLPAGDPLKDEMLDGLESLRARFQAQREILLPLCQRFAPDDDGDRQYDLRTYTFFDPPDPDPSSGNPPRGWFWVAAHHLDQFNQATVDVAGALSQATAAQYANLSQLDRSAAPEATDGGFLVPVLPQLPAMRGEWRDWQRDPGRRDTVLRHGRIPDFTAPYRLGPYDKLFGWRYSLYDVDYGPPVDQPQYRGTQGPLVPGKSVGDGGIPSGSGRPVVGRTLRGYRTFGPYSWMLRQLDHYWSQHLRDTNFNEYLHRQADAKLEYMRRVGPSIQRMHYPQWRDDYPACRALAAPSLVPRNRVTYTLYYKVNVRSRYPQDDPRFLSRGSFATNVGNPQTLRAGGWFDVAQIPAARQIAQWAWEHAWEYETTEDLAIGIQGRTDAAGNPEWFPVYMVDRYVFGGADFGGEIRIENPANFGSLDGLPVPYLLDTSAGDYEWLEPDHDAGVRRRQFTYLGVARRSSRATVATAWRDRFRGGSPVGAVLATAQVELYNPTSWDLWTQDWRAQLVPVTDLGDWAARMEQGADDAPATGGAVSEASVRELAEFFRVLDPQLADLLTNH